MAQFVLIPHSIVLFEIPTFFNSIKANVFLELLIKVKPALETIYESKSRLLLKSYSA